MCPGFSHVLQENGSQLCLVMRWHAGYVYHNDSGIRSPVRQVGIRDGC